MIRVWVNGVERSFEAGTTVQGLLLELDVRSNAVAVEVNRVVVSRAEHQHHVLSGGDQVEVVSFVGGG